MKSRSIGMSWMIALLAACSHAPAPQVAPEPAAAAATATVVEPEASIEDGVDPSVWDNEGEPEEQTPGAELTCKDNPLATHFFTLVGGNTWTTAAARTPRCWPCSTP